MNDFKGNLGNYKILKTEDNTETVWSEYFDEACHNLSGAYEETLHNYINGCGILDLFNSTPDASILDVGFGVGVGLKASIDQFKISPLENITANYYSIELDESLMLWSFSSTLPDIKMEKIEMGNGPTQLTFYQGIWQSDEKILNIKIFIGDGRLTLPLASFHKILKPIDAIFQDAFSPRKNPTLWSVQWFKFLKTQAKDSVKMSTYSSSVSIRKSLIAAGWTVVEAQGFARKKSMTLASLTGKTCETLIDQLERSPTLEIHDKCIKID